MSAWSASEMLAQAYADWIAAVRADDTDQLQRAAAASKANGGPDYATVLRARNACVNLCAASGRFCAWHFYRWWATSSPRRAPSSDCVHCGEPIEYVRDYGLRGWASTDQLDYDNDGMHCRVTDEDHTPYSIDLRAVAA